MCSSSPGRGIASATASICMPLYVVIIWTVELGVSVESRALFLVGPALFSVELVLAGMALFLVEFVVQIHLVGVVFHVLVRQ